MPTTLHPDPHPVTHSWHVQGLQDGESRAAFDAWAKHTQAILMAVPDIQKECIRVTYDLWKMTADRIESALQASHLICDPHLLSTLQREWFRFADQNERDHLASTPRFQHWPEAQQSR
ncbi:MAG: hypothetical protein HQM03_19585 [Magnetococcales bacterium]|nr:hypothetical protein [Magnetococcales bacterium]